MWNPHQSSVIVASFERERHQLLYTRQGGAKWDRVKASYVCGADARVPAEALSRSIGDTARAQSTRGLRLRFAPTSGSAFPPPKSCHSALGHFRPVLFAPKHVV